MNYLAIISSLSKESCLTRMISERYNFASWYWTIMSKNLRNNVRIYRVSNSMLKSKRSAWLLELQKQVKCKSCTKGLGLEPKIFQIYRVCIN